MSTIHIRVSLAAVALAVLSACGTTPQPVAVVETRVVTQVVEVTREVTREVVITATPLPAIPTVPSPSTPTPLPAAGKWELDANSTSSFDDSKSVVLHLEADQEITGQFATQHPSLILRCKEKELDAYVVTGMQPDVETGNLDGATVRLRFDKEAAETANTSKSTDGEALFFDKPRAMIDRLVKHDMLVFGFTPFSSNPVETSFDLRGLDTAIAPLNEACA